MSDTLTPWPNHSQFHANNPSASHFPFYALEGCLRTRRRDIIGHSTCTGHQAAIYICHIDPTTPTDIGSAMAVGESGAIRRNLS
jgi:hypothetical protein